MEEKARRECVGDSRTARRLYDVGTGRRSQVRDGGKGCRVRDNKVGYGRMRDVKGG